MGVNNSLLKSIQTIVDKEVESASFDKTRQAQVITNNNDGTYTIRLDGILYNNVLAYPYTDVLSVGDVVKVCIPSNQTSHMYIKSSQGDKAYVKKSGDTMTGTLTVPQLEMIGSNGKIFSFKKTLDDANVDVGWDWSNGDGAGLALRNSDNSGSFVLYARNSTTAEYSLVGKTDGSLTWAGKNVVTLQDTGWISLIPYLNTGYAGRSTDLSSFFCPAYRIYNNVVYFRGFIYSTTAKNSQSGTLLTNLPSAIRVGERGSGSVRFLGTAYHIRVESGNMNVYDTATIGVQQAHTGYHLACLCYVLGD